MELNAGGILFSSNVHTKAPLYSDGYKQTQVGGIQSWAHVELVRPPTYLTKIMKLPIQIDTNIILVDK